MRNYGALLSTLTILMIVTTARAANNYLYGFAVLDYSCQRQYGGNTKVRVATTVFGYCPYGGRWGAGFDGNQFASGEAIGNALSVANQNCGLGSVTLQATYWQGAFGSASLAESVKSQPWCQNGCATDYVSIYVPNECHP